jgi:hypothetical protein
MANFVAFHAVKIDNSFLNEFVSTPSVPVKNQLTGGSAEGTPPVRTESQARELIKSYFSVSDTVAKSD